MTTPGIRTAARAATVLLVAGLVLAAAPAGADVPNGWPDSDEISLLNGLFIYLIAPLALFVLITVLTVTPSLVRGERPGSHAAADQWFGGRRGGPDELESGASDRTTGGASGSW